MVFDIIRIFIPQDFVAEIGCAFDAENGVDERQRIACVARRGSDKACRGCRCDRNSASAVRVIDDPNSSFRMREG